MLATVNGAELAYTDEGKGFPLVFLHGFPLNRRIWSKQVAAFKDRYRVIVPDLRGFGESSATRGAIPIARYASDVLEILKALAVSHCILIGHSMGGYVALDFAKSHPEMVLGLVLVGTRAGRDSTEVAKARRELAVEVLAWGPSEVLEQMVGKLLANSPQDPHLADQVRDCMQPASADGIHGALLGMADRPDFRSSLAQIRVPTLVVAGVEDRIIPIQEARELSAAISDVKLLLIPGAGHLVALEQSAAFNEALKTWLAWGCNGPQFSLENRRSAATIL